MEKQNLVLCRGDIPNHLLQQIFDDSLVGVDTETSGLDWRTNSIGVVQLYTIKTGAVLLKVTDQTPQNFKVLLGTASIRKIFHFAAFDLKFIYNTWGFTTSNVACTKIASKLLNPSGSHKLVNLVSDYLGVKLKKDQGISNWFVESLTNEQINYAIGDVQYLIPLINLLETELTNKGLLELALKAYECIMTHVELEVRGYQSDIFDY
jgi:ribonuclease D